MVTTAMAAANNPSDSSSSRGPVRAVVLLHRFRAPIALLLRPGILGIVVAADTCPSTTDSAASEFYGPYKLNAGTSLVTTTKPLSLFPKLDIESARFHSGVKPLPEEEDENSAEFEAAMVKKAKALYDSSLLTGVHDEPVRLPRGRGEVQFGDRVVEFGNWRLGEMRGGYHVEEARSNQFKRNFHEEFIFHCLVLWHRSDNIANIWTRNGRVLTEPIGSGLTGSALRQVQYENCGIGANGDSDLWDRTVGPLGGIPPNEVQFGANFMQLGRFRIGEPSTRPGVFSVVYKPDDRWAFPASRANAWNSRAFLFWYVDEEANPSLVQHLVEKREAGRFTDAIWTAGESADADNTDHIRFGPDFIQFGPRFRLLDAGTDADGNDFAMLSVYDPDDPLGSVLKSGSNYKYQVGDGTGTGGSPIETSIATSSYPGYTAGDPLTVQVWKKPVGAVVDRGGNKDGVHALLDDIPDHDDGKIAWATAFSPGSDAVCPWYQLKLRRPTPQRVGTVRIWLQGFDDAAPWATETDDSIPLSNAELWAPLKYLKKKLLRCKELVMQVVQNEVKCWWYVSCKKCNAVDCMP